jgi:hypothetical protein
MDVAILASLLIFGGLLMVLGVYVSRELPKKLDVATWRAEVALVGEKELAGFRKACNEIQMEWESVYTKFVRLYSRSVKQAQEDSGAAKGGANSRGAKLDAPPSAALTREDIKRMIALGKKVPAETEWQTGSPQEQEA